MTTLRIQPLTDNSAEDDALSAILSQAFDAPDANWPFYREAIGRANFRVAYDGDKVVGGVALYRMGQWFGGRTVPMVGIAAVAVAPEHRGSGVGLAMMRHILTELAGEGVALSTLFPATQRPYRAVGYEQAGFRVRYAVDCDALSLSAGDSELPVHAVDASRHEVFHAIDRARARRNNGNLDRSDAIWGRIVDARRSRVYAYVVGAVDAPEGYVIFRHAKAEPDYDVATSDLVALTPTALRRLWRLLASHRSQAGRVLWAGPAVDPRIVPLREQTHKVLESERWMTRIVDVTSALTARGYPPEASGELHLAIRDEQLPQNAGNVTLSVSGGVAVVESGGRGDMALDVSALAPLYTSLHTATELRDVGLLAAPDEALATAEALFQGPEPWMPDPF